MTVDELIKILQTYDPDNEVGVWWNGREETIDDLCRCDGKVWIDVLSEEE